MSFLGLNLGAKKSLGQNFLKNPAVIRDIIEAGAVTPTDTVLEIGPGKGALSEAILATGCTLIAIEKDDRMIPFLTEKFANYVASGHFKLIHGDIIEFTDEQMAQIGLTSGNYKVLANIPYYITGEIMRKFLESTALPSCMILMVQKEVAERIVERDGKGSILSKSVAIYGRPKYIRTVVRGNFDPIPNVDSAVIGVFDITKQHFVDASMTERDFFAVLKAGFAHKRKLTARNLESVAPRALVEKVWTNNSLDMNIRPEALSTEQWIAIAREITKNLREDLHAESTK